MAHADTLPIETLKKYLLELNLIGDDSLPMDIYQYPGGYSNLTYRLRIGEQSYVLRRPPKGAIKRGHDMHREYRVLSGLNKTFDKVPKVFSYQEDQEMIGAPFYLMEEVKGIILHMPVAKKLSLNPSDFQQLSSEWLDTFVALHQLDYEAAGLGELGKPDGYVERQVLNWGKQYLKAATDDIPEAQKVMQWMEENQPKEYDNSLIHNDYKYNNVVFADESWQEITAILDWEMCTLGDPLMDLGTSLGYWITANDPAPIQYAAQSPTTLPGNPDRSDLVELYAQKSGRSIRHLTFYYVYGVFKIAVIAQQIYYRYQAGHTKDERFAQLNQFTKILCQTAWRAVQNDSIE